MLFWKTWLRPLTSGFLAFPTQVTNICSKFQWNPSTEQKDIMSQKCVTKQVDRQTDVQSSRHQCLCHVLLAEAHKRMQSVMTVIEKIFKIPKCRGLFRKHLPIVYPVSTSEVKWQLHTKTFLRLIKFHFWYSICQPSLTWHSLTIPFTVVFW